eukprot:TRINITY_DN6924_c5_g1_i1.p2 TRINITY_DN6924_c5_g1~~TRINITY_DN6924_c5_g1_i1.p2  ORF type:complete len:246 (+),score=63.39 TRINITY_DN6924_c5_g1_i1:760-1497(+)
MPVQRVVDESGNDAYLSVQYMWDGESYDQDFGPEHVRRVGASAPIRPPAAPSPAPAVTFGAALPSGAPQATRLSHDSVGDTVTLPRPPRDSVGDTIVMQRQPRGSGGEPRPARDSIGDTQVMARPPRDSVGDTVVMQRQPKDSIGDTTRMPRPARDSVGDTLVMQRKPRESEAVDETVLMPRRPGAGAGGAAAGGDAREMLAQKLRELDAETGRSPTVAASAARPAALDPVALQERLRAAERAEC